MIAAFTRYRPSGDPYFSSVVSLLHFDGSSGSTVFTDQKSNTWTATSANINTSLPPKFGTGCGNFLLSGANIKTTSAAFALGSGDFTAEGWFYLTSYPTSVGIFIYDNRLTNTNYGCLYFLSGQFQYFTNGVLVLSPSLSPTTGGWHHWALVRKSGVVTLYYDGTSIASAADSNAYTSGGMVLANRYDFTAAGNVIYLDDTRFTAGVARYTANFTPPTAPFPNF